MHAEPLPDEELLPPAAMDADLVIHRNLDEDLKTTATANIVLIESNLYHSDELMKRVSSLRSSSLPWCIYSRTASYCNKLPIYSTFY